LTARSFHEIICKISDATDHSEMRRLLLGLIISWFAAASAYGRDSTCLLGDDGKVAVTTFEHRAKDGRATDVTLIYGSHFLKGALSDTDSGKITLSEHGMQQCKQEEMREGMEDNYIFKGTIKVDYDTGKITLKGKLKFYAGGDGDQDIDTVFECKELQPN
jgi:hypothetical protein